MATPAPSVQHTSCPIVAEASMYSSRGHDPEPNSTRSRTVLAHPAARDSTTDGPGSWPSSDAAPFAGSAHHRLRPHPMVTASDASARIPPTLPRGTRRSLGHFSSTTTSKASAIARLAATPATRGSRPHVDRSQFGRNASEAAIERSALVHCRPDRPRPADCASATTNAGRPDLS